MKILVHESNKRALMLALSSDDRRSIEILDKNHLVFGMYQVWYQNPEGRGKQEPTLAMLMQKYPDLQAVAWLNIVIDFVPGTITDISKGG